MTGKLTIEIIYDLRNGSKDDLHNRAEVIMNHLDGNGMLTGDTDLSVNEWFTDVEVIKDTNDDE
jgi:hypothetical protein